MQISLHLPNHDMGKQGPQTHPDRRQKKKPFQVGPKLAKGSYTGHSQSLDLYPSPP
mgnify:CR=1 FL=1